MKKLLLSLLLFPTLLIAQPQSFLAGENINIDALKGINMCSGTGNITLATSCTGGGTQYTHTFNRTTGKFQSTGGVSLPDGTAAAPSLNFTNDTNLGLYRIGDDDLGIALNGAGELRLTSSSFAPVTTGGSDLGTSSRLWNDVFFSGNMRGSNGSITAPTYGASADTNTGVYFPAADSVGITTGGTLKWTADSTGQLIGAGTAAIGWAVVDGTDNTACTSQCVTPAVFGFNLAGGATAPVIVGASDATADICLCAGSS